MLNCGISLCDDGLFRGIFGQIGSEAILTDLVNSVLRNAGDAPIQSLVITNPFQLQDLLLQKEPILDIKAKDEREQVFDIEIQVLSKDDFRERILYYWARLYGHELQKGDGYRTLRPVIGIIFTKFSIYPEHQEILYDTFQIKSKNYPLVYSDHLRLHFITVPDQPFPTEVPYDADLRRWLKTLNYPDLTSEDEMENIAAENPLIEAAFEKTKNFLATPSVQEYIEARYRHRLEAESDLLDARDAGKEEGLEEGKVIGCQKMIKDQLKERFGDLDAEILKFLENETDHNTLRRYMVDVIMCADWAELKQKWGIK